MSPRFSNPDHAPALRLGLVLVTVLVVLAVWPAPARAHTDLMTTTPADGAVVTDTLTSVSLTFSKPVQADTDSIEVVDANGNRIDAGDAHESPDDPNTVVATLRESPTRGAYGVRWRVIASDSHPREGSFSYTVDVAVPAADAPDSGTAPADTTDLEAERAAVDADIAERESGSAWTLLERIAGMVMYLGALLAVGSAIFLSFVYDGRDEDLPALTRILTWAALVGGAATLAEAAFHAGAVGNVATALAGPFGLSVLIRLTGLGLLAGAARGGWSPSGRIAGLAGLAAVAASLLLVGHDTEGAAPALTAASHFVHAMTAAAWFGGVTLLAITIRRRRARGEGPARSARIVDRFSTLALGSVAVAAAAGLLLSWVHLSSPADLFTTGYGLLLMAKLVLVGIVGLFGAFNHRVLVPRIVADGDNRSWSRLARTARSEAAALVGVVFVTAIFVTTGTPAGA